MDLPVRVMDMPGGAANRKTPRMTLNDGEQVPRVKFRGTSRDNP
jgi:hypothetical protein